MGRKVKALNGQRFGKWTVLEYIFIKGSKYNKWLCVCDCGTKKAVRGYDLTSGRSKSCGCTRTNKKCDMDCFNCKFDDCINSKFSKNKKFDY